MACAPHAGLEMPMHRFHVDRWKDVIDEADMILSKGATIHQNNSLRDWFASRYPTGVTRFQNYLPNSQSARGILPGNKVKNGTASYPNLSAKKTGANRSEEHTSELQSHVKIVCR